MRSKVFMIMSLVVIAGMALAACNAGGAAPAAPSTPQAQVFKSKDPTTFVFTTFGEPETLDVALDYETAGAEIIQNVYETLLFYKRESINDLVPQLATEIPTTANGGISADGKTYTFKIRQNVKFHNGDVMTPEDVAYSFQRGILQGGSSSPMWLIFEPIMGSTANNDITDLLDPDGSLGLIDNPTDLVKQDPAKLKDACTKVTDAIKFDNAAGTVTFNLAQAWGPFLVTIAGPFSSVQDKKWDVTNGAWDGDCATWQNFYGKTSDELNKSQLGIGENGTGPYMLDKWTPKEQLSMKAFDGYWRTEPAWDGGPSGVAKEKEVIIKFVDEFSTRLAAFQAGDADIIQLGSPEQWPQMDALTGEICDPATNECKPTKITDSSIRVWEPTQQINRTDAFFNFNINTEGGNNFIGSGKIDGNGITPDFFNDIHIRRAFNYCFDWDTYIKDVQQGQGKQANGVMLFGMLGDDNASPKYNYDPEKCKSEFQASTLKSEDGKSLWDAGFRFTITYNTGNTARQSIAQILQTDISSVNENFVIEATGLPWPTFLKNSKAKKLPLFIVGWQEDIPDTHNWTFTYGVGYDAANQNMPQAIKDILNPFITQGVHETDPAKRAAIYKQFNQAYYDNAPGILLAQQFGRHYEQRWVKGYYNNPIYGNFYYYALSKD